MSVMSCRRSAASLFTEHPSASRAIPIVLPRSGHCGRGIGTLRSSARATSDRSCELDALCPKSTQR
eukprot:4270272-Pleurochrysis_carterae.AAC.1